MKPSRLSGRKVNDYLRRKGNVWKGGTMTIKWLRGAPKNPNVDPQKMAIYLGSAASLKLHKSAVKRNRMRRRCREAFRRTLKEHKKLPTIQLLLSPRSASLDCDFDDILRDVESFLSQL
jgi:ribonuclease P protein component